MILLKIILIAAGALILAQFLLAVWPSVFLRRFRPAGRRPAEGLVIFVEGIRWLNFVWDRHCLLAGLRQAGFGGDFLYWRWHATWRALLVLPVIAGRLLLEREARRLADFIQREFSKGRPIYLMGSSCGGYLTIRVLELLPPEVRVQSAAVLAGALSPWRDLAPALERVEHRLIVTASRGDWMILGLLTILGGTADRRHVAAMGMMGPRRPGEHAKLRVIRFDPTTVRDWLLGGHFTTPAMVRRWIWPAMRLSGAAEGRTNPLGSHKVVG